MNYKLSNTISQSDSNISSQIALATKEDGAAMKTIAVVTLTFLPATFVTVRSTIFLFLPLLAEALTLILGTPRHEFLLDRRQ